MEAVGSQVILVLLFPIFSIAFLIAYNWAAVKRFVADQMNNEVRIEENQQERQHRIRLQNDAQCCICLTEPKELPVASTCGHSFCASCILSLHEHRHNKLLCPLCRQQINILFKLFESSPETHQIQENMREYNRVFDDNRSLVRRITQLPYVLRRVSQYVFRVQFLVFVMRNLQLIRLLLIIIFYVLLPFDLLPERVMGIFGYIDDALIAIIIFLFFVAIVAIRYIRQYQ